MKKVLNLKYPVSGLSPMDGVSDNAFRFITKKYGNPQIMFTEFTNVMGLSFAARNLLEAFKYDESQRPIIAQIYGTEVDHFYSAAKIVCELGFDGVDINMGCPSKTVASHGSGAGLIRTPDLAREIIASVKEGVKHWVENGELTGLSDKSHNAVTEFKKRLIENLPNDINKEIIGVSNILGIKRNEIPVSVKTRIGYDKPITEEWIKNLTLAKPSWISLHGRTLKQMYTGMASRDEIKKGVDSTDLAILANGDIKNYYDIQEMINYTGSYGTLIGRGTFGNPWIFREPLVKGETIEKFNLENYQLKVQILLEHTKKFIEDNPEEKSFVQMRKHFGWYIKGFDGAKEIREKLMRAKNLKEVIEIFKYSSYII